MENIILNNGFNTALSGVMVVFAGLVTIALVIVLFNWLLSERTREKKVPVFNLPPEEDESDIPLEKKEIAIPEEHRIAIAAALELYRRIHFDVLRSEMSFVRGEDAQNAWKMGNKYGQRVN